jgi:hypothetical protein
MITVEYLDNFRRNQIMRYISNTIYKYYVSQIVGDDIIIKIFEISDRNALIINID